MTRVGLFSRGQGEVLCEDLQREFRLTYVVVLLTVVEMITVLPYMIGVQIYISYKLSPLDPDKSNIRSFVLYYLPFELSNFALNPIVYAWRLPKYRQALLHTFKCSYQARLPKYRERACISPELRQLSAETLDNIELNVNIKCERDGEENEQ